MRDLYGNKINIGDLVIFESDKYFTKVAVVKGITGNSIHVDAEGFHKQIYKKCGEPLPVVVLGRFLRNKTTGECKSLI